MQDKKCSKCELVKPISEFYKKQNTLQSRCKICFNSYTRQHYIDNKAYYKQKAVKESLQHRLKIKTITDEIKSNPCKDCGVTYPPYVMDFDHVIGVKIDNVSYMNRCTEEKVLKEIAKCEVVCSNCHRERTHKRRMSL